MSERPAWLRSEPRDIQVIAVGNRIRILKYLRRVFGGQRWRKLKGRARVELDNGRIADAEVHWFEAHGVGRVHWKIKDYEDNRP